MIIRPKERTQIRGLPWTGKPADNYAILEDCIGASRRGQIRYENGSFTVTRT